MAMNFDTVGELRHDGAPTKVCFVHDGREYTYKLCSTKTLFKALAGGQFENLPNHSGFHPVPSQIEESGEDEGGDPKTEA